MFPQATVHPACTSVNAAPEIKVFLLLFRKTKEEVFFFEKKNQKTFISGAPLPEDVCVWRFGWIYRLTGRMVR
jgi:hypothetical protein